MSEKFIVTFFDDDKKTILDKQEVEKGASVEYHGKIPAKSPENGIEYEFVGWNTSGNLSNVTENINVIAIYEAGKISSIDEKKLFELSLENAENAKLVEVMNAGKKIENIEKITRNMTKEEKLNLVNEIIEKGSVDIDRESENERD